MIQTLPTDGPHSHNQKSFRAKGRPTMHAGDALRFPSGQPAQTFFRVRALLATRPRAPDAAVGRAARSMQQL